MKTMNVMISKPAAVLPALMGPQALQLMQLGERRGWEPLVLGKAPLPDRPTRVGDWLLVPVEQDTSCIPARALRRVQAIYEAGMRPQGFVVVHEAPRQLAGPTPMTRPMTPTDVAEQLRPVGAFALKAAGVVAVIGACLLTVIAAIALPIPFLLIGAIALDPILVAVTEDGDWIEIDRWWSEPQ
jgi:hypothetical protein